MSALASFRKDMRSKVETALGKKPSDETAGDDVVESSELTEEDGKAVEDESTFLLLLDHARLIYRNRQLIGDQSILLFMIP